MRPLKLLYLALFFSLPLSVENFSLGFGINIPSEPLQGLVAIALLFYIKPLLDLCKTLYRNPLFIVISAYIGWSWISCLYSGSPVVSAKYTLIETLHILVFVTGLALVEKHERGFWIKCVLAYTACFIPLLLHGLYLHAQYNFAIDFSAAAMRPFYRDHPLYGVVLAFLIPLWVYFFIQKDNQLPILHNRRLTGIVTLMLLVGLLFSFSRAAWLTTVIGALAAVSLFYAKQHLKQLLAILAVGLLILIPVVIFVSLNVQKREVVKNTTIGNQLLSSFNWTHDVANLERLNRYKCAWRMFKEKPLTGFGNNMYKFTYLAYQKKEEMTRISLSDALPEARKGTGGNSHSDYLAALTELGLPGFIFWCGIVFFALFYSCRLYVKDSQPEFQFIFCAFLTYFIHVLVNNFIHDDKISALVWMCCAAILIAKISEVGKTTEPTKMNPGRP